MATDANGNVIPNIDPQLAGILNAMSAPAWPRPGKKAAGDVVIPPPATPPNTDADTNPANVTDSNPPVALNPERRFNPGQYAAPSLVDPATGLPSATSLALNAPTPTPLQPGSGAAPAPNIANLPTTQTAPPPPTASGSSIVPNALPFNRWSLTRPVYTQPTSDPLSGQITTPSYQQASTDPATGLPTAAGPQTKLGKLLSILRGAGIGAAIGSTQPTFGRGLMAANEWEDQQARQRQQLQMGGLQAMMARQQLALAPQEMQLRQAQLQAQLSTLPLQQQLLQAQVAGAYLKEVPGVGLVDTRTGKLFAGQTAALSDEEAAALGGDHKAGDTVPLTTKNMASELANRGTQVTTIGGRSILLNKGTKQVLADLGPANQLVMMNAQNPFAGTTPGSRTGEDALQGLAPEQQTLVRKIANYEEDPTKFRSRNPQAFFDLMKTVNAYDPSYDETQYATRAAVRRSFTSGPDARNIQSLNMVAHHLDLLDKANDALNSGNVQALNQIANAYNLKVAGQSPPAVFQAVKNAVAGELGTTFKGASATDPEIASIGATIDASLARQVNKNVIAADVGLIQGRLKALQFKYEQGTQKPADFQIVSPEAQGIFNRLGGGAGQVTVTDPRGAVHTFPDQAAADRFRKAAAIQ